MNPGSKYVRRSRELSLESLAGITALAFILTAAAVACEESPADPAGESATLQASVAAADTSHERHGPFGRGMLRLLDELALTQPQQAEVERIHSELRDKNEPLVEQLHSIFGVS